MTGVQTCALPILIGGVGTVTWGDGRLGRGGRSGHGRRGEGVFGRPAERRGDLGAQGADAVALALHLRHCSTTQQPSATPTALAHTRSPALTHTHNPLTISHLSLRPTSLPSLTHCPLHHLSHPSAPPRRLPPRRLPPLSPLFRPYRSHQSRPTWKGTPPGLICIDRKSVV